MAILYTPRTHSALIELAAGEERLYRLPPVSKGQVTVKAFHADVSLRAGRTDPGEPPPATRRVDLPPSLGRPDVQALALDDDNGGGPHSDTSPARNLELELRLGNQTVASHGNLVQAESPNHTDGWRLRVRRLSPLNDLTPNPGQYRIEASYMSQLPILERRIPASFFHDGFEANWNKQQYVYGYISGSKVFIYFREDLRLLHGLEDLVFDTGVPLVEARNIHTTSVRLDVGAGPSPRGGSAPFFSVRVDCAADGMIEVPLLPDVTLPAFYVTIRLYLCRRGDGLEYVPVVESDLLDLLADVEIGDRNAKEAAKKAIEDALYELQFPSQNGSQSGFSSFGNFLAPWLIGDRRELWSIGYAPGPADSAADTGWDQWSSVSDGGTAPGSPVTAVEFSGNPGRFAVFVADPGGGIYTTTGSSQGGWDQWSSVSDGRAASGSPVTAVALEGQSGRFAVFVADPGGGIYTTLGSAQDGWDQWSSVSDGSTAPGSPVTAIELAGRPGRFAVFVADPGGGIYTTSGSAQDGWDQWSSVSDGRAAPGSPITAVEFADRPGRFAVFVTDPNGGIYTTSGSSQSGWDQWSSVSDGRAAPGSPVTAIEFSGQPGRLAVFVADPGGVVYTTSGSSQGARAAGIVEPATGELLVSFVGPSAGLDTGPVVVADPDEGSSPPDDGSIRLFDVPEEDPDPEPGTGGWEPPGGGGATPPPRIGSLAKIDHVVVLMMENRSFDQVLGYLSRELGRTEVDGLNDLPPDIEVNPQYNRYNNRNYFPKRAESTAWPSLGFPGPCHETDCVLSQIDEKMGRFVSSFAERVGGDDPRNLRLVMDYFGADQLPVYAVLAREFGICDSWYTAHAGPTWPNRFVLFTGDLNLSPTGNVEQDNPDVEAMLPLKAPTLFDHLNERGVSWRVFENGYSFIRLYRNFTFDTTNVVPFDDAVRGFEVAARSGALPQVTLIEPDYIDAPPGNDDHPPGDMADGQDFINRIVQALIAGPQWERTLFVITYDEHGGFYDHKPPPTDAPPLRGGRRTLGPRVPTFVVSPFVKRGDVFHSRFDHTSIGATILRRFAGLRALPRISARLDSALDLREALTLAEPRPRSDFASLGLPPLTARRSVARSALEARNKPIGLEQGRDDFHWLLSFMRLFTGEGPR